MDNKRILELAGIIVEQTIEVVQDGADFYNDKTGKKIYTAPFKVKDFDMTAAKKAREEFKKWFSSEYPKMKLKWVGP